MVPPLEDCVNVGVGSRQTALPVEQKVGDVQVAYEELVVTTHDDEVAVWTMVEAPEQV